jgi:hypothetical protein
MELFTYGDANVYFLHDSDNILPFKVNNLSTSDSLTQVPMKPERYQMDKTSVSWSLRFHPYHITEITTILSTSVAVWGPGSSAVNRQSKENFPTR